MANKSKNTTWTEQQRADFMTRAPESLKVVINGSEYLAVRKEFSTGSVGYHLTGKTPIVVDGRPVILQMGLNLAAIGSKPEQG